MSQPLSGKTFAALWGAVGIAAAGMIGVGTGFIPTPMTDSSSVSTAQQQSQSAKPRATYKPRVRDDRAWSAMSEKEISALHEALKGMPAMRVDIFCGGTYCQELAEDLDEAFESAGFDSYMQVPMFDIGKGYGIAPDNEHSRRIAKALSTATDGRINLEVHDPPVDEKSGAKPDTGGGLIIALARKPAKR